MLAGAKGLTLFQSYHDEFQQHEWNEVAKALRSVAAVRETLRQGDVAGLRFTTTAKTDYGEALIEVIRSPDHVVVAVVSTNASGYSNTLCHLDY